MRTLIRIFIMAILATGLLNASAFEKEATSRTTKVVLSADNPLVVGNNSVELLVTLDNAVADGAAVALKVFMPAMPGMPAMESTIETISLGNGRFKADVNFAMSGTWQIHILITPETGRKIRVKTSVNI
ncbi:MAG: FixH family protein [Thiovulaceae bacterium]|nr:FixH family protein [Sulfurimonadaceae bacterium]